MRPALLLLLIATASALAQENTEFTGWMKATGTAFHALQKLDPKTGPEAVSGAERLGGVYENMIAFWRQRDVADAVKWSVQGKAAAVRLATAAHAGDAEAAAAAFQMVAETCGSCHQEHREKTGEGRYRIKMPAKPER